MALVGAAYQVRAGTITTPLVGDVVITDTAAEMCSDASTGTTIIPVSLQVSVRLSTGTLQEYAAKSVGTVSSAGAAFVPLPLRSNAAAATSTARVAAAGGVTVTAELATTTARHWEFANPVAAGAGADPGLAAIPWQPRVPPTLVGPRCFYVQIAATTTGPSYYAHYDFIEGPTATLL
jgi:endoglucanase Acf2